MSTYMPGSVVRLTVTFTNNAVATDPTTVQLLLKGGTQGLVTYTYGSSAIAKDSVGNYHYDFTVPSSGQYNYRWTGTGTVVAAAEGSFTSSSAFL